MLGITSHKLHMFFLFLFACLLLMTGCQSKTPSVGSPAFPSGPTSPTGVKRPPPKHDPIPYASVPVKVCCGAMSFYAQNDWAPVQGKAKTFCTNLPFNAQYAISVNNQAPTDEAAQVETVPAPFGSLTGAWTVKIRSYKPNGSGGISREGAQLHAAGTGGGCSGNDNSQMAVTLSVLPHPRPKHGSVGFYATPGPASAVWKYNRRFQDDAQYTDYNCAADRDKCERIAEVEVEGGQKQQCTDPACNVFIKRQ